MSATVFNAVQYLFMINIVMYIYLYLLFSSFNLFFTELWESMDVPNTVWEFMCIDTLKKDYELYRGNLINEVNLHIYY